MGRLGLSPRAVYDLTLGEFALALKTWSEDETNRDRREWERVRWLATITLQPHAKKGRKIKPQDLAYFPWEHEEPAQEFSRERTERNKKYLEENTYLAYT